MDIPVIYVGGPYDGQTGEEPANHREGDPPGRVYVFGFEEWPMDGGPPAGRYDPDTSEGKVPVPFIWRAYSPEEQSAKWRDPDRPVKMWRTTERYPADE